VVRLALLRHEPEWKFESKIDSSSILSQNAYPDGCRTKVTPVCHELYGIIFSGYGNPLVLGLLIQPEFISWLGLF